MPSETSSLLGSSTPTSSAHSHKYMTLETHEPNGNRSVHSLHRSDCQHGDISPNTEAKFHMSTYQTELNFQNEDELMTLLNQSRSENEATESKVSFIINISLIINVILFGGKVLAYMLSGSLSVAASVVDSFLDLLVQLIIYIAHDSKNSQDKKMFPAGKSRIEPVGLILCAALMFIACLELISRSFIGLYEGIFAVPEVAAIDIPTILVIMGVIAIKSGLWIYCQIHSGISATVATLSFDHRNDVLSNIVALFAILAVILDDKLWWADALGCILISVYIGHNWYEVALEKINELVGGTADDEFIAKITSFVEEYHPAEMELDVIRAYHFGSKYLVEIEVVMPESLNVKQAHDLSLALQQAIERMEEVERAFVHVDYQKRHVDEHDVEAVIQDRVAQIQAQKTGNTPVAGNNPVATEV